MDQISFQLTAVVSVHWLPGGAIAGTYNTGDGPGGLAYDGANAWVTNYFGKTVTKLRANDGFNLGTFTVGDGAAGIAFDGTSVWVVNNGDSTRYEGQSFERIGCHNFRNRNRTGRQLVFLTKLFSQRREEKKQFATILCAFACVRRHVSHVVIIKIY